MGDPLLLENLSVGRGDHALGETQTVDMRNRMNTSKRFFICVFLLLSLMLCAVVRIVGVSLLHGDVFDPDSARFLRQAKLIVEEGDLPDVDNQRWSPIGVEMERRLTLFPHVLAGLFKGLSLFVPSLTIEDVAILFPVIFSILSGYLFYLLVNRLTDTYTALLSVNLAIISWPWVSRTTAGYADRDAFVLFLALAAYYFYVRAYQTEPQRRQLLCSAASGVLMALVGLTWEGSGLLITVIVGVEFIKFVIGFFKKQEFYRYLCWVVPILGGLLCFKKVYWQVSQPISLLALGGPTLLLLLMVACLIIRRFPNLAQKLSFKNRLPLEMSLVLWAGIGGILVSILLSTQITSIWTIFKALWSNFLSPLEQNRLWAAISELQKQGTTGWISWPGIFFCFTAAGVFLLVRRLAAWLGLNVWLSVALFELVLAGTVLTRILSGHFSGRDTVLTSTMYVVSILIFLTGMGALYLSAHHRGTVKNIKNSQNALFLLMWLLVMLLSARGAVRFEFFLVPIAIAVGSYATVTAFRQLTAECAFHRWMGCFFLILIAGELLALGSVPHSLKILAGILTYTQRLGFIILLGAMFIFIGVGVFDIFRHFSNKRIQRSTGLLFLTACLVFVVGSPFPLYRGYTATSTALAQSLPFLNRLTRTAFEWMKINLPQDAVIAASWEYGSFLNLHANRATVMDEEQVPYWVYLLNRHVMLGQTEREALEFLKARRATHLLLTQRDMSLMSIFAELGSDETFDRRCTIHQFGGHVETILIQPSGESCYRYLIPSSKADVDEPLQLEGKTYSSEEWRVSSIYLQAERLGQSFPELKGALVELDVGEQVFRLRPAELYFNGRWIRQEGDVLPCTLLIHASRSDPSDWNVLYFSQRARQSLMVQLYFFNRSSEFFTPIYPLHNDSETNYGVRVWEIHYPSDIVADPKYLLTEFPDSKLYRSWMKGEKNE